MFLYVGSIVFRTNINTQVRQLIFVGFRREIGENKETSDLLYLPIIFVSGIYQQSHKSSDKFGRSLIFWKKKSKNYISYIWEQREYHIINSI
jgi:hypothetical protein